MTVTSDRYPDPVNYVGTEGFPDIGIEYIYVQYATADWHEDFLVDRNNIKYSLSEEQCEILEEFITNWVQELGQEGNPTQEQIDAELASIASETKLKLLSELSVTTEAGNTFDAYDEARANMNESIMAAGILGITENQWKLADNSIITVSVSELQEALALGIQAKGKIILGEANG